MSELTDDQLDGLFRKSAEEFDPPFDPAAWQDMKTRLDTHDRPMPGGTPLWKNMLRWGLPVCLLLLLMVGGWYAYDNSSSHRGSLPVATAKRPLESTTTQTELITTATQQQRSAETRLVPIDSTQTRPTGTLEQPVDKRSQPTVLAESATKKSSNDPKAQPTISIEPVMKSGSDKLAKRLDVVPESDVSISTNGNISVYKVKTERSRISRSKFTKTTVTIAGEVGRKRTQRVKTERFATQKQGKADRNNLSPFSALNNTMQSSSSFSKRYQRDGTESDQIAANTTENIPNLASVTTELVSLPTINELSIRPAHWPKALIFTGRDVAVQPDTVSRSVVSKPTPIVQRGLSIRFAVAPDLSSVGLTDFSRPGTNIGVLLEYRFASRWSVQTGLIQSTKVYRAQANEYDFPWSWPVDPTSIDGRCNMFDIPINVRYDFALRPRLDGRLPSRWFVSGGVTSYIMNQENYVYNYSSSYVHNAITEKSASTGNYGFSNLNISTGYERAISRRLSWQIEPFVKVPLRGVGFFNVNLMSTGAFFSIRYKL